MKYTDYFKKVSEGMAVKVWVVVMMSAMATIILLLSIRVLFVQDRVRTIVTPASVNKEFWTDEDKVSKSYLDEMSNYFSQLRYNVTPANSAARHTLLLSHVSAEFYSAFDKELRMEDNTIRQTNISTFFVPTNIACDEVTLTCKLTGEFIATQSERVMQRAQRDILIKFTYADAKLHLDGFKDLSKNDFTKTVEVDPNTSSKIDEKSGQLVETKVVPSKPADDAAKP